MENYNPCIREVVLTDIADVVRPAAGKIYPAGTVYIRISACRRPGQEQFFLTETEGEFEGRECAVVIPKKKTDPVFLKEVLNKYADRFMHKYVGKSINIQLGSFKFFKMCWNDDYRTQRHVGALLTALDRSLEATEKAIEAANEIFVYMLN